MIGGPGSGKSYAAAKIAAIQGMEAYDLDELFWDSSAPTYGVKADQAKRDQALADLVLQETWVIEGVYYRWLTPSFERADLIILLTPSVWLRDWRIMKRTVLHLIGRSPARKKETLVSLFNLLQWNHTYEKNVLVPTRNMLSHLNKSAIECKTSSEVFAVLGDLKNNRMMT